MIPKRINVLAITRNVAPKMSKSRNEIPSGACNDGMVKNAAMVQMAVNIAISALIVHSKDGG